MVEKLASEKVVLSSPMSFSGSAARLWRVTQNNNAWLKWLVLAPVIAIVIFVSWTIVAIWYVIMYVLFGIFFIPWRLFRRSHRKNKKLELQHREVLEHIKKSNS